MAALLCSAHTYRAFPVGALLSGSEVWKTLGMLLGFLPFWYPVSWSRRESGPDRSECAGGTEPKIIQRLPPWGPWSVHLSYSLRWGPCGRVRLS